MNSTLSPIPPAPAPSVDEFETPSTRNLTVLLLKLRAKITMANMALSSRVMYVLAAFLAAGLALTVAAGLSGLRTYENGPDVLALVSVGLGVIWACATVIMGSSQYTVDPRPLLLLPINEQRLMVAYMASTVVSIPSLATLIVALTAVGFATGPASFVLLAVGAVVEWVIILLAGRVLIATLDSFFGGRRSKDLAVMISIVIGTTFGLLPQLFNFTSLEVTDLLKARSISRWTPWGVPGEAVALAAEGSVGQAALWFVASVILAAGLFVAWARLTIRNFQVRADNQSAGRGGHLIAGPLRRFRPNPVIAVWSRSMRDFRRDVRQLSELASLLPLAIIVVLPSLGALRAGNPILTVIAGGAGIGAAMISTNLFGFDGANFNVDLLTARNLTPVVAGKALARATVLAGVVLVIITAMSWYTSAWAYLPVGVLLAVATIGMGLTTGVQISVRKPVPMPKEVGLSAFNTDQAALAAVPLLLVAFALSSIAAAIVVAIVAAASWLWLPSGYFFGLLAAGAGVAMAHGSIKSAGSFLDRNGPEFLIKVSKRTPNR